MCTLRQDPQEILRTAEEHHRASCTSGVTTHSRTIRYPRAMPTENGPQPGEPRAWLVIAAGDDRIYGGNDGYDDEPDSYYSWDSTVHNHAALMQGDRIVLWDKHLLLGASVIEEVESAPSTKVSNRCPACDRTNVRERLQKTPRWRCYECHTEFDQPNTEVAHVHAYRSRHDAGWTELHGVLDGDTLRSLCVHPKSQQSIRSLRWDDFVAALSIAGHEISAEPISRRSKQAGGGHVERSVRVRLGQSTFRKLLIETFGSTCAVTGVNPPEVLEAGHLYSYAALGVHHNHGGLLFRRDIHALFDRGRIAIEPDSGTISVDEDLLNFDGYAALHGMTVVVQLAPKHRQWLAMHWDQYRT